MIFQFNDGEFSGPVATSLKMWKKINNFIVIKAFSVTLKNLNRNPQAYSSVLPSHLAYSHGTRSVWGTRIFMFLISHPSGNVRIQKLIARHIFECFEKGKGEDGKVSTQGFN